MLRGNSGVDALAETMRGDESVYLGIRPFGLHSGNLVPLVVYPILLCEALERVGKTPKLKLNLFLNDYEQFEIDGPNVAEYPFNVYPKETTIQYTYLEGTDISYADYWSIKIIEAVSEVTNRFSEVTINPVRNSEMKSSPVFKEVMLKTMRHPELVSKSIEESTSRKLLEDSVFAMPLCPNSRMPITEFSVNSDDQIELHYEGDIATVHDFEDLDYWFYHKPLAIPRLHDYQIELCITGADHLTEGDYHTRQLLIEKYGLSDAIPKFETLYTPELKSYDGIKMSKSKGNYIDIPLEELIDIFRNQGYNADVNADANSEMRKVYA